MPNKARQPTPAEVAAEVVTEDWGDLARQGLWLDRGLWRARCAEAANGLRTAVRVSERRAREANGRARAAKGWARSAAVAAAAVAADAHATARDRYRSFEGYREPVLAAARQAPDGRVRASWARRGPGRWCARGPALQTVTKSYGLRGCFRAAADAVLVVGDWSAAHLWLAAAFSGDPVFAADLTDPPDGRDPYQRWAIEAGAPVDRATAKRQVLALLNGAGTARLAVIGAVPATRVRGVAARWFRRYGVLRGYLQAARGAETWASSPAWCARTVDASDVPPYARPAWRWQAAEADALAVAVRWLHHEGVRVVLTVHDEIVVEAPAERAPAVVGLVHQAMADGFAAATGDTLVAPAVVSVRRTWGED